MPGAGLHAFAGHLASDLARAFRRRAVHRETGLEAGAGSVRKPALSVPSFKQRPDTSVIRRNNSSARQYSQENGSVGCNCAANRRF